MGRSRATMLELVEQDRLILERLSSYLQAPRNEILRWALRWYLLDGPWPAHPTQDRSLLTDDIGPLVVGPMRKGGAA